GAAPRGRGRLSPRSARALCRDGPLRLPHRRRAPRSRVVGPLLGAVRPMVHRRGGQRSLHVDRREWAAYPGLRRGRRMEGREVRVTEIETYAVGNPWKAWLFVRVLTDE